MQEIQRSPPPEDEINRLKSDLAFSSHALPKAFIIGHGLWSDLDVPKTLDYIDTMIQVITSKVGMKWDGLFVTPSAAGKDKPVKWVASQGSEALMRYEETIGREVVKRGLDHLGTWNMSVQARKYDGVHLDMRGNLVKAMMVINWLSMLREE